MPNTGLRQFFGAKFVTQVDLDRIGPQLPGRLQGFPERLTKAAELNTDSNHKKAWSLRGNAWVGNVTIIAIVSFFIVRGEAGIGKR